jgi:hypothetical protein
MSTNITTVYQKGDGNIIVPTITTVIVGGVTLSNTAPITTRIVAIHANAVTVAGTFDIGDKDGSKIQFQVGAGSTSDIYIGEMGIRCEGTVSVSTPGTHGGVTLILG